MGEDSLKEIAEQLKRIANCLETLTSIPEIKADPKQVQELEELLNKEPLTVIESSKGAHQDIVNAWNKELVPLGVPKINSIRSDRARLVSARIKEYGEEAFYQCIEEVKQSSFLLGKTQKPWTKFSFDWLIKPNNFPKVLEGNYNDNRNRSSIPTYSSALPESWLGN